VLTEHLTEANSLKRKRKEKKRNISFLKLTQILLFKGKLLVHANEKQFGD